MVVTSGPQRAGVTEPHRDPGLQAERTSLAWSRTLIGLVAVSAVCVRVAAHLDSPVLLSAALYAAAAGFVAMRQAIRYRRAVAGLRSGSLSTPALDVLLLTGTTVALALQLLWWVAISPG